MIGFPVSDPARLFVELGVDNSCELSMEEFINGCMQLNGCGKAEDQLLSVGELSDATFAMEAAKEALSCVTKAGITAIRSLCRPPQDIHDLFAVIGLLIKRERKKMSWKEAQQMIWSVTEFLDELKEFNAGDIPESVLNRCAPLLAQPAFTFDAINNQSVVAAYLVTWVLNVIKYNKIHRKLEPFINKLRDCDEMGRHVMFTPPNELRQMTNGRATSADPRVGSMLNGSMRESGPLVNGSKHENEPLANDGPSESQKLKKVLYEHWSKSLKRSANANGSPPRIYKKVQTSDALILSDRDRRIHELESELAALKSGNLSPVQDEEAAFLRGAINQAKIKLTEAKNSTERLALMVNKFEERLESLGKDAPNGPSLTPRRTNLNSPRSNTVVGGRPMSSPRSQDFRPSGTARTSQVSPRANGCDPANIGNARHTSPFSVRLRKSLPADLSQVQQYHTQRQPNRQASDLQSPRQQTPSVSAAQQQRVEPQGVTNMAAGFHPQQTHAQFASPPAYVPSRHTFGVQAPATYLTEQFPVIRHTMPSFLQPPSILSAQRGALTTARYMSPAPMRMDSAPDRYLHCDASRPANYGTPIQHAGSTLHSTQNAVDKAIAAIVQPQNALLPKWELKSYKFNAPQVMKSSRASIRSLALGGDSYGILQRGNPQKSPMAPKGALNGNQAYDDTHATPRKYNASPGTDRHSTNPDADLPASIITDIPDVSNEQQQVPAVSATTFLRGAGDSSSSDWSAPHLYNIGG
eukprot:GEMP01013255.1.p1 GENE.GEMP01013255.1~~GEMP01013255.1.p1  ORF type:complete len:850 (+),score=171.12 GEMP01013255.1:298-2550(+)